MEQIRQDKLVKRSFGGALAFYLLIAFEFFYMAGPFAAYFYSVYAPALNFFNKYPALAWLNSFFLPHAARETSSILINSLEIIGIVLAIGGFLVFCIGACQVYYHKLTKKGAVTGGIYNRVRHPQYASFIVCSFGLLLLWPRYIVAILFVTMLFAYHMLAKVEEKECLQKFGESYAAFMDRTTMFIPARLPFLLKLPVQKKKRAAALVGLYLLTLCAVLGSARGLQMLSLDSLYATYTQNTANIALCQLSDESIDEILLIASGDENVKDRLAFYGDHAKQINYILPVEWFAAEVPMNGVELRKGHFSPKDYDRNLYKVIFTIAEIRSGTSAEGHELLNAAILREPVVEVWVDMSLGKVTAVMDMPENVRYQGVPVSVY